MLQNSYFCCIMKVYVLLYAITASILAPIDDECWVLRRVTLVSLELIQSKF